MKPAIEPLALNKEELEKLLEHIRPALSNEEYKQLKAVLDTLAYLIQVVENKNTTIHRLRQILVGASTEKTAKVLKTEEAEIEAADSNVVPPGEIQADNVELERKGHGRNGAQAYSGARKITIAHPSLKSGDRCQECKTGKLYEAAMPGLLVRVVGQAPLVATVYELEKFRCNLCGEVFTAAAPEGVGSQKYDASAAMMIALLKYGSGFPFHRLEGLQSSLGIPLPASTQWEIVEAVAGGAKPAFEELIRQAAQGEVLYNDDTTMKILALMGEGSSNQAAAQQSENTRSERRGVFTSGIVSTCGGRKIALFFTGRKHAGENLGEVLAQRAKELGPPIQMCDALSRNLPGELKTIVANCNAHARRKYVDVVSNFPEECRYVLEILAEVYKNDALCREQRMSPEERLRFHQAHSGALMKALENSLEEQLITRKVEPNSGLGQAMTYMRKHWKELTLFLRQAGAPLDNNVCERALKKAILHRKGSLFYKTENGARVGDLFMSLIHTCQLCGANPFDYLTALQKHVTELSQSPDQWMPWNYRETLEWAAHPAALTAPHVASRLREHAFQ